MMPPHILEFLDKIAITPHGSGSLKRHLIHTYDVLCAEGQEEALCLAGLFHSIYGTKFYKPKSTGDREMVSSLIGERAERLVWLFCQWDRHNPVPDASKQEMAELAILESANRRTQ